MIILIMPWVLAALSLTGVVLNIYKKRTCFFIWVVTNSCWMCYDFYLASHTEGEISRGLYAQAFIFFIYFCLSIWGIIQWGRDKKREEGNV